MYKYKHSYINMSQEYVLSMMINGIELDFLIKPISWGFLISIS